MFKKVRKSNGVREFYLGKIKLFQYVNSAKFAEFVENRFNVAFSKQDFDIVYDISMGGGEIAHNSANLTTNANPNSISNPNHKSFYHFQFLLNRAHIAHKYHKIFYDFYLRSQRGEELIFIDGGCHNGVFADVALASGGVCYAFEPNVYLCAFLRNLYKDNPHFILNECAIATANKKAVFYGVLDDVVSQGASVVEFSAVDYGGLQSEGYEVEMIDFCAFVRELVAKHGKIHFIKLDIEGAEFEVLEAFIAQDLHKNVEYIMVETHERIFDNPKAKIEALQAQIKAKNITNIYLDWV